MSRSAALTLGIAGLLSIAAAAPAYAAPLAPDKNATGTVEIIAPVSFRKLEDLNFAYLSVTTAGTAVVDPNTDLMTTTGGVLHAGGLPYAAQFEAVSPVRGAVIVRLPRDPITVTRVGGTETDRLELDRLRQGQAHRRHPGAVRVQGWRHPVRQCEPGRGNLRRHLHGRHPVSLSPQKLTA